jgi:hypothetical protein
MLSINAVETKDRLARLEQRVATIQRQVAALSAGKEPMPPGAQTMSMP